MYISHPIRYRWTQQGELLWRYNSKSFDVNSKNSGIIGGDWNNIISIRGTGTFYYKVGFEISTQWDPVLWYLQIRCGSCRQTGGV